MAVWPGCEKDDRYWARVGSAREILALDGQLAQVVEADVLMDVRGELLALDGSVSEDIVVFCVEAFAVDPFDVFDFEGRLRDGDT